MPEPVLWPLDDHTRAKHKVLIKYLDAWLPVMGLQAQKLPHAAGCGPRLLIVDGFAGPGCYEGREPGSPILMLNALLNHTALPKMRDVQFYLLFIEQDARRVHHLQCLLQNIKRPSNVEVYLEHGAFEETFGGLVDKIKGQDHSLIPTFAFIDPFGYSAVSMSLTCKFLDFPRSEALFFLPLSFVHRFVGRAGQETALTNLFNSDRWREAIPLEGADRSTFLLKLFEQQLRSQEQVKHVRSFELHTKEGNEYRLVFATQHDRGLELMKEAMWSVDPVQGTRYVGHTDTGQQVLFQPEVDTRPLLSLLRVAFGKAWFSVADAEKAMLSSDYVASRHLKTLTLKPAEREGVLIVKRTSGSRAGTFTNSARMRFA